MGPSSASRPSSLACRECRRKHLKCDAQDPVCGRCITNGLTCTYIGSRRGMHKKRSSRNPQTRLANTPPSSSNATSFDAGASLDEFPIPYERPLLNENSRHQSSPGVREPRNLSSGWYPDAQTHERLLGIFYTNFYDAHPFLVPRAFYAMQQYPEYLGLLVCFIGQQHCECIIEKNVLLDAVSHAMAEPDEMTVARVQALVLYAITLYARNQLKEAEFCISRAAKLAFNLGLNDPAFAASNSTSFVQEESYRRSWWELYTVDLYLAAILRRSTFKTNTVQSLFLLPCQQSMFELGARVEKSPTLQSFDDRVFMADSQYHFSSYCYRIDAVRIIGRIISLSTVHDAHPDSIQAVDNALVGWEYNLPPAKASLVGPSGEVDQMLFQARCFISCANIFLHFPRSDLPETVPPSLKDLACVKGYTQLAPTSRHHGIKAINASKTLSDLATLPWPLERHSPLLICGLVLGCIIQLAAGTTHSSQCGLDCLQQHRDRVVLMLGALQRLGERWALAQHALGYLRSIAGTVFSVRDVGVVEAAGSASDYDSANGVQDNLTNMPWLDLLAMEDFQGNLFGAGPL